MKKSIFHIICYCVIFAGLLLMVKENRSLKSEISSLKEQNENLIATVGKLTGTVEKLGSVAGIQVTANLNITNRAVLSSLKVGNVNALLSQTVEITKDSVLSEVKRQQRLELLREASDKASNDAWNKLNKSKSK